VLLVAAASITLGVVAGLLARRRPFAMLRATGIHLRELRRMVLLETALPLAVTSASGIVLGLAVSAAVASAGSQHWTPPGAGFAAVIGAGLMITLGISAAALPLLKTATELDAVRFD
jgi:ABC-type antimicrobial peptide transport system permease subunit